MSSALGIASKDAGRVIWGRLVVAAGAALFLAAQTPGSSLASLLARTSDLQIQGGQAQPSQLVFACELATGPLESLFSDPNVISDLKDLNAGVSLALIDLSPGRARVVAQLNRAGIPVTAWLVLPKEEGYFLNAGNAPEASARFASFEKWSADHGLQWAGVGLDIEPNIRELAALTQGSVWHLIPILARRSFDSGCVLRDRSILGTHPADTCSRLPGRKAIRSP